MTKTNEVKQIEPSRDYYLNVAKPSQDWKDGEFCPVEVKEGNEIEFLDGMYGLLEDVAAAMFPGDGELTDDDSDKVGDEAGKYDDQWLSAIKSGAVEGTANGIAGERKWRLVFSTDPHQHDFSKWIASIKAI